MKKNHSFNNNIPSFSDYFFLLRLQSYAPSTVNLLFFDCKLTLLRFYWTIRLVILNFSFAFTAPLLWFYWNAEPSTLTRRAFAIETPKARYRNDEPSATSWIQRIGSVNPHKRCWISPKALQKILENASEKPQKRWNKSNAYFTMTKPPSLSIVTVNALVSLMTRRLS